MVVREVRETTTTFTMRPVLPFRLDFTAWALRRLPSNQMDLWDGTTYRRVLNVDGWVVEAAVTQQGGADEAKLRVGLTTCPAAVPETGARARAGEAALIARVRQMLAAMLGSEVDLTGFYALASKHEHLDRLARRFRGVKPPLFPSVFEGVVNGIACQQLSLNVGITLLDRLSTAFGRMCGSQHAFPRPDELAAADGGSLRSLGFSTRKAENIVALSRSIDSGEVDLEKLRQLDDSRAIEGLDRLPGVGRWTAEYVALRGLGRLDVFPSDDVGAQNRLREWLGLEGRPGYDEINRTLAAFRPYRGLIYFHLLLNLLAARGYLSPGQGEE